jgi:HAD superfamily phosphoserine phosphatase-like hydrolase
LLNNSFSFFDFDNTLYKGQSRYLILDFSAFLVAEGVIEANALNRIQEQFASYHGGRINRHEFAGLVVDSYYQSLQGHLEIEVEDFAQQYWSTLSNEAWFTYTQPLLALTRQFTSVILISGSPFEILKLIHERSGFSEIFASRGIVRAGAYTGEVELEMATRTAKERLMLELSNEIHYDPQTSFAFGDSESDFPMLEAVNPRNAYLLGTDGLLKNEALKHEWNTLAHEEDVLGHVQRRIESIHSR